MLHSYTSADVMRWWLYNSYKDTMWELQEVWLASLGFLCFLQHVWFHIAAVVESEDTLKQVRKEDVSFQSKPSTHCDHYFLSQCMNEYLSLKVNERRKLQLPWRLKSQQDITGPFLYDTSV